MARISILITFLLCWTNSAYALINVEALFGKRWYQTKNPNDSTLNIRGSEIEVGINVDPIPLVPVSLGLSYSEIMLNKADLGHPTEAEIDQLGIDLKAWLPIVPVITPYARARYILSSKLKVSYDNHDLNTHTNLSGYSLGVGIDFKIIPMLHALLEFNHAWETAQSFAGKKRSFDSSSLLIGLQVGV